MAFPGKIHGERMELSMAYFHGNPMAFHGNSMAYAWQFHGNVYGNLHGKYPWQVHGLPWPSHSKRIANFNGKFPWQVSMAFHGNSMANTWQICQGNLP